MYDLQTNYSGVGYRDKNGRPAGATIYSGGCCPTSVGNVLRNLCGISEATTRAVCTLATQCGARYNGGTSLGPLLTAAKAKWGGFTYQYTNSDSAMKTHLKNGGMAVAHTPGSGGGATGLFSSGGHFVAMIGMSGERIKVADPYYYANKWTQNSTRRNNVTTTGTKGVVIVNAAAIYAACDYYYLVSKETPKVKTRADATARAASRKISKRVGTINAGMTFMQEEQTANWVKVAVWIAKKGTVPAGKGKIKTVRDCTARISFGKKSTAVGMIRKGVTRTVADQTENWMKVYVWIAKKNC